MKIISKKQLLDTIKIVAVGLALGVGTGYLFAWSGPHGAPTDCPTGWPGCDAPIHVGSTAQSKAGALALGTVSAPAAGAMLDVYGTGAFTNMLITNTLKISGGSPQEGMLLTAKDNTGIAEWKTPAGYAIKTGVITTPVGSYVPGSFTVSFTTPFDNVPVVMTQAQWTRYTGDEDIAWWVTDVTTSGFTVRIHTPSSGTNYGEGKVMWLAIDKSGVGGGSSPSSDVVTHYGPYTAAILMDGYGTTGGSGLDIGAHKYCFLTGIQTTSDNHNGGVAYVASTGTWRVYNNQQKTFVSCID